MTLTCGTIPRELVGSLLFGHRRGVAVRTVSEITHCSSWRDPAQ
jgi:hypothetical protein